MKILTVFTFILFYSHAFSEELITQYTSQNQINNIVDYQDYIWCGTNNGLIRINRHTYEQTQFKSPNGPNSFCHIDAGPDGSVWSLDKSETSCNGEDIYNFNGEKWTHYEQKIRSFTIDSKNRMWTIGTVMRNPNQEHPHYTEYHQLLQIFDGYEWETLSDDWSDYNDYKCMALDEKTNTVWVGAVIMSGKITVLMTAHRLSFYMINLIIMILFPKMSVQLL